MIEAREKKNNDISMEEMLKKFESYFKKDASISQDGFHRIIDHIHEVFAECSSLEELSEVFDSLSTWHITNMHMGLYTKLDFTLISVAMKTDYLLRKSALRKKELYG